MTTATLPDLTHRAPDPRWLDAPLPTTITAPWLERELATVRAAAEAAASDPDAWIDVVLRDSELSKVYSTYASRVSIAYRQQTDDDDARTALEHLNRELSPRFTDGAMEISTLIAQSPCRAQLAARFGEHWLARLDATCAVHDERNTALTVELSDLLMQHTKRFGAGTITWRGEQHPMTYWRKAALDSDRDERHGAWRSMIDYVQEHDAELQTIFDDARVLRQRMAATLGMTSYTQLRYREMQRLDWGPEDAARARAALEQHVAPVVTRMRRAQARALGTELLHPADVEQQVEPAVALGVAIDDQLAAATEVFDSMGADSFGAPWRMLVEEGLVDVPARVGKGPGAFCASMPWEGVPFIFLNSVGAPDDVRTLVHEYGHALQVWRSRVHEPVELRWATAEAAEIHSMSLELLALNHLAPFFGTGTTQYAREHLRSTLEHIPYMVAIDEFQHRIYDEQLDAEGRAAAWREIAPRLMPAIDHAADDWYAGARWVMQLHVFHYPFYYLDYALAQVVAWQLWLASLEDHAGATRTYLKLCDAGGTAPFRTLVREAGLGDPFDPAVIERTMRQLEPHLGLDDLDAAAPA
jgi:M3 family oligoendopeptidase